MTDLSLIRPRLWALAALIAAGYSTVAESGAAPPGPAVEAQPAAQPTSQGSDLGHAEAQGIRRLVTIMAGRRACGVGVAALRVSSLLGWLPARSANSCGAWAVRHRDCRLC